MHATGPRPSRLPRPLVAGALTAGIGLALVTSAGADVLVSTFDHDGVVTPPVLVTAAGATRALASVPSETDSPLPVVSPDRRFVAVGRSDHAYLLPTDGTPAIRLDADAGAGTESAFWWTGATRVTSFAGGLDERGDIRTCGAPGGPCRSSRAPGGERIGTFRSGASLWQDDERYELPEGLNSVITSWTTATATQVRRLRAILHRRLRVRVILRSATGATRVLQTTRRSSVAGVDDYLGHGDGGPQVLYQRSRTRTTLLTRKHHGRTQAKLRFSGVGRTTTGVFSASGRSRPVTLRAAAGTFQSGLHGVVPVPGGWLLGSTAKDGKGTPLVGSLAPGGAIRSLRLGGKPMTARSLSAAVGVPIPADDKPAEGEQEYDLEPVGYEAATSSDVVTYYEPSTDRQVVARVPRSGAAPSLVLRTAPGQTITAISW